MLTIPGGPTMWVYIPYTINFAPLLETKNPGSAKGSQKAWLSLDDNRCDQWKTTGAQLEQCPDHHVTSCVIETLMTIYQPCMKYYIIYMYINHVYVDLR